jgi:hypothetical protein
VIKAGNKGVILSCGTVKDGENKSDRKGISRAGNILDK